MMTSRLEAFIERAAPLANSGRSAADKLMADSALKKELQVLYKHYFGQTLSGCKNCHFDALIRLYFIFKNGKYMTKTDKFKLRRGVVLIDVVKGNRRLNMVRGTETEDLALYHLMTNPSCEAKFEHLPEADELEEMLEAYTTKYKAKEQAKVDKAAGVDVNAQMLADAEQKAQKIIKDAEAKAAQIIAEAEAKAAEMVDAGAEVLTEAKSVKTSK